MQIVLHLQWFRCNVFLSIITAPVLYLKVIITIVIIT